MKLRIGTRGSELALAQARSVARALGARGHAAELVVLSTRGDADPQRAFAEIGAPGVFVREIERALLEGHVELAVHSYKDLPSESPPELAVAAVPGREDPRDLLLAHPGQFDPRAPGLPLREGARLGTAAARRRALARELRPDLRLELLRGNVPTRVARLLEGRFDAIVLAAAGLARLAAAAALGECAALDLGPLHAHLLDPELFVPAPSQGAIAVQARADDPESLAAAAALDDPAAHASVRVERALLTRVAAGCDLPFGAFCRPTRAADLALELFAVLEQEGSLRRVRVRGHIPELLADAAFQALHAAPSGAPGLGPGTALPAWHARRRGHSTP